MKKIQRSQLLSILCWLIGHKFVWTVNKKENKDGWVYYGNFPVREDYCVRCGIKYEDINLK